VAIADGRIFTAGRVGKETHVIALGMDGKELWRRPNGESWEASAEQGYAVPYAGARGTPTVDGDTACHLSDMGRVAAFEAATGKERWHVDLRRTFEAPRPKYGYCESVLLQGDRLFCCPGGKRGYLAALDRQTGRTLWTNTEIDDPIGYCSPVVAEIGDVEQLVCLSAARIFAVKPDTGKLLWQHVFGNERNNSAADALVHDGLVFASCGYGGGSVVVRPQRQADGTFTVAPVWSTKLLDNHHGGVLLLFCGAAVAVAAARIDLTPSVCPLCGGNHFPHHPPTAVVRSGGSRVADCRLGSGVVGASGA